MTELEYQKLLLSLGRISRRQFMGRALALGASTTLAGTMLSQVARASEPKKGGTLKLGMGGGSSTDSMDPATVTDSVGISQCFTTYNYLVELDAERNPVPELAESWEAEPGARKWIFKLRRGVEFHNGKTLEAEDVAYSINRHLGPDAETGASGIVAGINRVYADDKHTVIFELDEGNADLPYVVSDYHLGIVPDGFEDWDNPIGTGPYRMEHYDPGVESLHVRNENYWKEGRAHADSVEYTIINDSTARTSALRAGQVHAINRVPRRTAEMLSRVGELEILSSAAGQHYTLPMHTQEGPLTDANLRLALAYAIDRDTLVDTVMHGFGRKGNDNPIPEIDPFFHTELEQRPYDPDRAKHYLQQAGEDRFSITLHTSEAAFAEAVDTAVLFQEAARAANIEVDVKREPADGYWSDVWMNVPFCMSYWGGRATADMMFAVAFKCGGSWNESFFCDDEFDSLLGEARVTLDEAKRRDMYWRMQEILNEQVPSMIPLFGDFVDGYRKDEVGGYHVDYVWELSGHRPAERLWLET